MYRSVSAEDEYKTLLRESREGTPLNKKEFYEIDKVITEGLKKGQHIYHIISNTTVVTCSKSTVYSFRDIVPKGFSFDAFTEEAVNRIFSHVNSASRALYGGKSAMDMFSFIYSEELTNLLGIVRIPPNEVVQSPALLKNMNNPNLGERS